MKRTRWASAVTAATVAVLLSGCELFPTTSGPQPEVVAELRAVGKVVASTTTEWYWDGHTDVDQVVVVDIERQTSDDAAATAIRILQQCGWKRTEDVPNSPVVLQSSRWDGASVWVAPFVSYEVPTSEGSNEKLDASNAELFRRLRDQGGTSAFVVLTAMRSGSNL